MGVRTNAGELVEMAVAGAVTQPTIRPAGYIPDPDGKAMILPGMSGVVYNVRAGDPAFGWAGDHVEPGVSIAQADEKLDFALHYLACLGNDAVVTSGLAAGAKGVLVGEHARLLVEFSDDAHAMMNVGDMVQIKAVGRGLRMIDYPQVNLKKMSPRLFEAMGVQAVDSRKIRVPVAMELPIRIMGSGAELNSEYVDQDLMSGDRALMAELGIDRMRMGDLIVINHADHHWGRSYRKDAVSICICIHGDSIMTGHGPGILTLMTCAEPCIEWTIDPKANLADLLQTERVRA
ncbi:MAG: DUF4438 domain-containing protein [Rhodospirillales bacterium]|jgi:hypothetical protein